MAQSQGDKKKYNPEHPAVFVFSSVKNVANEESGGSGDVVGFVNYEDDGASAHNKVVLIDFYKPAEFQVISASVQTKFGDIISIGGTNIRLNDVSIRINGTKTKITTGIFDYYRWSAGTVVRSSYNPTADDQTVSDELTSAQIEGIIDGWNTLVLQQDTNDTTETHGGYACMDLVIKGFFTFE